MNPLFTFAAAVGGTCLGLAVGALLAAAGRTERPTLAGVDCHRCGRTRPGCATCRICIACYSYLLDQGHPHNRSAS